MNGATILGGIKCGPYGCNIPANLYDPAAAAFFAAQTAAGQTLTSTQMNAVNTLCLNAKANGWWGALVAFYPFLGNSATCDSFNLVDPTTFFITWYGTVTHNANGVTGDGSTGYGDTGLFPSVGGFGAPGNLTQNNTHIAFYGRSASPNSTYVGSGTIGVTSGWSFYMGYFPTDELTGAMNQDAIPQGAITFPSGFCIVNRPSASLVELRNRQNQIGTGTTSLYYNPVGSVFVLAINHTDIPASPSAQYFMNENLAMFSIGSGLTSTLENAMEADIQTFQTALSRQV
jgi:hypothetical protein